MNGITNLLNTLNNTMLAALNVVSICHSATKWGNCSLKSEAIYDHFDYIGRLSEPNNYQICKRCKQTIPDYPPALARHLRSRHGIRCET